MFTLILLGIPLRTKQKLVKFQSQLTPWIQRSTQSPDKKPPYSDWKLASKQKYKLKIWSPTHYLASSSNASVLSSVNQESDEMLTDLSNEFNKQEIEYYDQM